MIFTDSPQRLQTSISILNTRLSRCAQIITACRSVGVWTSVLEMDLMPFRRLAEEILEILYMHQPEAVVDLHNKSGSGPSFGVCTFMDRRHDALVSLFTRRMIVSNLRLGALM
jgi:hypothetical protein